MPDDKVDTLTLTHPVLHCMPFMPSLSVSERISPSLTLKLDFLGLSPFEVDDEGRLATAAVDVSPLLPFSDLGQERCGSGSEDQGSLDLLIDISVDF